MRSMSYRILETDEACRDAENIACEAYDYTRDVESGRRFLRSYDEKMRSLITFPMKYRGVSLEYRGYEIRMLPFENYNMFFVVNPMRKTITVLRVLYQLQDWMGLLMPDDVYHVHGRAI